MDPHTFNRLAEGLDSKITMVDQFVERAHKEGISIIEAGAMQEHVRRQFSPKQRTAFRQQISELFRDSKITMDQKQRMDLLLDKASKVADQHFLRLSRIVPEGQELKAPKGLPGVFNQRRGDPKAKRVFGWFGLKEAS